MIEALRTCRCECCGRYVLRQNIRVLPSGERLCRSCLYEIYEGLRGFADEDSFAGLSYGFDEAGVLEAGEQ